MVLKQHSFIDVCCGAAHALIIILLWKPFNLQY